MVEYIIGNYMAATGRITTEQLEKVIEIQDKVRVKLGLAAVAEGLMSEEQAEEINRLQAAMDKRFGDIAVEKGYLTAEQLGHLLKVQGNEYLVFVQTLVDEGLVRVEEMEGIVEEFREANDFTLSEIARIKSGEAERIVPVYLPQEAMKYEEIIGIAVRMFIRCIDRHVYVEKAAVIQQIAVRDMVTQRMDGEPCIVTGFSDASRGMCALASAFAKEEFREVNEDVLDACGEFLNCINGLYASGLSLRSVTVELCPPKFGGNCMVAGQDICIIPICMGKARLYFMVSDKGSWR